MVLFNYSTKELTAKIVYYGPGLCGKTTNLQWIHEKLPIKNKGKMLSLATETDRTLFFDFLPIELGTIRGMRTRVQLYTVPGQVFYNATRRMVLKGADCVVFVCDSQEPMLDANLESYENLRQNLEANEIDPNEIPVILQYNKRDLPNALPIEIMNERLNPRGVPFYEAMAVRGAGVEETLKGATALVFRSLAARYGGAAAAERPSGRSSEGPGTKPPMPAPAITGPVARPAAAAVPPAPAVRALSAEPARAAAPEAEPARARPPAAALATLPPTPPAEEEELEPLELQAEVEDELTLEVDDSEVLADTNPKPRARIGHDTVERSQEEADELRDRLRPPAPPAFEPVEDEIEEISLDSVDDPPPLAPDPPRAAPRPYELTRPSAALRAAEVSAAVPVPVEVSPGIPAQAEVTIPVQVMVGGQLTQVQINLRLILDLKLQK